MLTKFVTMATWSMTTDARLSVKWKTCGFEHLHLPVFAKSREVTVSLIRSKNVMTATQKQETAEAQNELSKSTTNAQASHLSEKSMSLQTHWKVRLGGRSSQL